MRSVAFLAVAQAKSATLLTSDVRLANGSVHTFDGTTVKYYLNNNTANASSGSSNSSNGTGNSSLAAASSGNATNGTFSAAAAAGNLTNTAAAAGNSSANASSGNSTAALSSNSTIAAAAAGNSSNSSANASSGNATRGNSSAPTSSALSGNSTIGAAAGNSSANASAAARPATLRRRKLTVASFKKGCGFGKKFSMYELVSCIKKAIPRKYYSKATLNSTGIMRALWMLGFERIEPKVRLYGTYGNGQSAFAKAFGQRPSITMK